MAFDPFVTARHDGDGRPVTLRAETAELARALADPRLKWAMATELPAPHDGDDYPCAIARRTCKIAPDGNVYPCPTYPEPAGNILRQPFAEIWRGGPLLDRLRAIRVRDLQGECHECSQSGYCGHCMAVAKIEHGDELGPSHESCRVATAKEMALGHAPRRGLDGRVRLRVVG
jgi:radical SAM protein with 4Fe4S-binding SPASM domain